MDKKLSETLLPDDEGPLIRGKTLEETLRERFEAIQDMAQFLVSMQEIEKITLSEVLMRLLEADIAAYNLEGGIV